MELLPGPLGSVTFQTLSEYCNIFSTIIYYLGLLYATQQWLVFYAHSEGFCWDVGAISLCFPTSADACKYVFEGTIHFLT